MGGRPISAMAVLGYAVCDYTPDIIKEILSGATHTLKRAGVSLVGGHSFDDPELRFGLSVTGLADKDRILRVGGAISGDVIVLTKPIGTGIITTAVKADKASEEQIKAVTDSMLLLNDLASKTALSAGATSCTDVTGFGLLGHACNMVKNSCVDFEIRFNDIPVFDGLWDFVSSGLAPEGAFRNLEYLKDKVDFGGLDEDNRLILSDPQTSGGLLFTLGTEGLETLDMSGLWYKIIGRVVAGTGKIRII